MTTFVDGYIIHWNAPDWCASTVISLRRSEDLEFQISVINNGGELDLPPDVRVIQSGQNVGFAAAANMGLCYALATGAPLILIACHDVTVTPGSLRAMVDAIELDDGLGVIGPVLNGEGHSERDLEWISGTLMLIRREVAMRLRFDARWGSYVEDVDFCYRARDLGWRIGRTSDADARTLGSIDPEKATVMMHGNVLVFFLQRHLWRSAARQVAFMLSSVRREPLLFARALMFAIQRLVIFALRPGPSSRQGD